MYTVMILIVRLLVILKSDERCTVQVLQNSKLMYFFCFLIIFKLLYCVANTDPPNVNPFLPSTICV